MSTPTTRKVAFAVVMTVLLFTAGTVGFHHLLHEAWHDAFYRTAITATLTGLDSQPSGPGAEHLTIAIALGGVAIFGYAGGAGRRGDRPRGRRATRERTRGGGA